jgi:hypothetical protein
MGLELLDTLSPLNRKSLLMGKQALGETLWDSIPSQCFMHHTSLSLLF